VPVSSKVFSITGDGWGLPAAATIEYSSRFTM
jgi:hypothetical protein